MRVQEPFSPVHVSPSLFSVLERDSASFISDLFLLFHLFIFVSLFPASPAFIVRDAPPFIITVIVIIIVIISWPLLCARRCR